MITSSTVGRTVSVWSGVEVKQKESEDDVMSTLEKCYSSLNNTLIQMILTQLTASGYRVHRYHPRITDQGITRFLCFS